MKPSWAANRAARIIRSGSSPNESSGRPGVRSTRWARSTMPPYGSSNTRSGKRHRHRVDGEVATTEVPGERVAVVDRRLAAGRVVLLRPVRGDLDLVVAPAAADRAEVAADVPDGVGPSLHQPLGDLGAGRGGEVEVEVLAAEHRVANRTTDQGDLLAGLQRTALRARRSPGRSATAPGPRGPAPAPCSGAPARARRARERTLSAYGPHACRGSPGRPTPLASPV